MRTTPERVSAGDCLGDETLLAFVEHRAAPRVRERVEEHTAGCDACREVLSALAASSSVPPLSNAAGVGAAPPGHPSGPGDESRGRLECATTVVVGAPAVDSSSGEPEGPPSGDSGGGAEALGPGAQVGRYRVLGRVGAGGMGVVYAAFDPELERKVALKFLRHDLGGGGAQRQFEARLRREAQAMAKLAHPNVAAVHDVGHFGGRVFVAMEFIDGPTLGRWLEQKARPLREVIERYEAAGRGLAAAHAAGLVHRDFKPDNVLVGEDGRVRVVDFGLARSADAAEAAVGGGAGRGPSLGAAGLTVAGTVLGTPAYMAPEQHRRREADEKSDQFSFCVALYEALYRERPFAGRTLIELAESVEAGRVRPAPRGARVPRHVRRVLLRGLSPLPERRFASMQELLAALSRDPARRARNVAAAALSLGLVAGGALWARPRVEPPCRGSERHLQGVWDGARRDAVSAALLRTGAPYAEAVAREVSKVFDGYAERWVSQHAEACEATRVRGEQTEELLGLRMACLDERRLELKALTEHLLGADREAAGAAVQAAYRLSELEGCADARALSSPLRPPPDGATRAEVERLRAKLAEARALQHAGRYKEGLEAARGLSERAEALRYRPLEAEAFFLFGELADKAGDFDAAARTLEQAAWAAEAGRHDEMAARTSSALIRVRGLRQAHYDQVEPLTRRVTAALERLGGNAELEAQLGLERGLVHIEQNRFAEAGSELEGALGLLEPRYGEDDLRLTELLRVLGRLANKQKEYSKAQAYLERAFRIRQRVLGDDHPDVAEALHAVASSQRLAGDYARAEASFKQALAMLERALGPEHPDVARVLHNFALVYEWKGDVAEAITLHRRAVAITEKALGAEHPDTATQLAGLASVLETDGQLAEALSLLERCLGALRRHFGEDHERVVQALHEIGLVQMKRGKLVEARDAALRGREVARRVFGRDADEVLQTLGDIELRLGRPARALEPLEAALKAQQEGHDDPGTIALTKGLLGRALFDSGRDRGRGGALVREACEHMKGDERMEEERADLERWVRKKGLR